MWPSDYRHSKIATKANDNEPKNGINKSVVCDKEIQHFFHLIQCECDLIFHEDYVISQLIFGR